MVETIVESEPITRDVELAMCPFCAEHVEEIIPITVGHNPAADDEHPQPVESVVCETCADVRLDLEVDKKHLIKVNQIGEADYSHVIFSRNAHMNIHREIAVDMTFKVFAGILALSLYFVFIPSQFSVGPQAWFGFVVIMILLYYMIDMIRNVSHQKKT